MRLPPYLFPCNPKRHQFPDHLYFHSQLSKVYQAAKEKLNQTLLDQLA